MEISGETCNFKNKTQESALLDQGLKGLVLWNAYGGHRGNYMNKRSFNCTGAV